MDNPSQPILARKSGVFVFCAVVLALLFAVVLYIADLDEQNQRTNLQERVLAKVGDLRTGIEQEINTTLNLTMGSLVYVAYNPDISQDEFARFAREIVLRAPYILNLGLAKDNVITHVYPIIGNEKALGLRYMDNPKQRGAVLRAMEARRTVIAGPVNLVQGGQGLISRIPIFLDDAENSYWGMTSIVVLVDEFFDQAGIKAAEQTLNIALRGKDAEGMEGDVFYGDASLFENPANILQKIPLPVGSWVLAAAPKNGWAVNPQRTQTIYAIGFTLAILICVLLYSLLMKNIELILEKKVSETAIEHKNRFFSYMAHELRTPLTAIQGAVKILDSDIIPTYSDKWKELLHNANRNCQRLQWIVNDILDLRKLESGKIEYSMSNVSILDIVHEAIDELNEFASQFHIDVVISTVPDNTLFIQADRMRIQQVIVNLLSNAIKFSPENNRVEIAIYDKSGIVRVEVRDNGDGIKVEQLDEIFQEFSQAKAAGEDSQKIVASTGLGLTISKHIINDHSGRIGCFNKKDAGAVFFIELPVASTDSVFPKIVTA